MLSLILVVAVAQPAPGKPILPAPPVKSPHVAPVPKSKGQTTRPPDPPPKSQPAQREVPQTAGAISVTVTGDADGNDTVVWRDMLPDPKQGGKVVEWEFRATLKGRAEEGFVAQLVHKTACSKGACPLKTPKVKLVRKD